MADQKTITVKSWEVREIQKRDGSGSFNKVFITATTGEVFGQIMPNSGMNVPNIGSDATITYQEVKLGGRTEYNVLSIDAKESTMTKGTTTNTGATGISAVSSDSKFIKIKGTLNYAHLRAPNTKGKFPSGLYQIDLGVGQKLGDELRSLGIQVLNKDKDGSGIGDFVRLKAKKQPKVFAVDGTQLVDIPLVGNGSKAIVGCSIYANRESNVAKGHGGRNCLGFHEVRLETFIPYESHETRILSDD